ncbi:bifunctional uridylyltransferase/uridylyl-removing protein GlnD [Ursidibacter arcticus]
MSCLSLKTSLTEFSLKQKNSFVENQVDVVGLLHERSDFYDNILKNLWQNYGFHERSDLALVAVGGYGRREMFPLSDLDILVLAEQTLDEPTQQKLNELFNLLWDCKLQLGTSIRTLAECISIGKSEISVATNMLESRFIIGNVKLWQQLFEQLHQPDFWAISDFFHAKMAEKQARYERYHNTSYNLEPDLKHSPGGLRDLHLLSWIMLRQYGIYRLEHLLEKGILYPEEYQELQQAEKVLFRMRFALHLQLKRYDNRLRFDRQLQLSEQLGYQGDGNQPVEAMMKTFFQATQSISQLSQLLLDSFEQEHLHTSKMLQKNVEKQPLDHAFILQNNSIYCIDPACFIQTPHTILELFLHLTQYPQATIDTHTLRQLRLSLRKLQRPLSEDPLARQGFIKLFQQPNMVKRAIVPMHQFGVLSAYLPQWKSIEGLMQFDMFHIYTVDEHTIRVMLKLESFLDNRNQETHPLCCELLPALPNLPLLYFSALFHDIAKGREGDHAVEGAIDMRQFAEQHNFSLSDTDYMVWLVAEHLTMSITAQRRDIHDPEVVKAFAKIVGNQTALSALTCLTVADICATNESLWNDWKRSLFRKLFQFTQEQLAIGNEQSIDYQKIEMEHRQQALAQLTQQRSLTETEHQQLIAFWQTCPNSYFIRNSPTQLVWHAERYLHHSKLPMVLVSNQYARGATEIFVHCDDQPQLFARIAHTLSQKKISIHDAQIITGENGRVLDSFIITESNGKPLSDERSYDIHQALIKTLTQTEQKPLKLAKKPIKHQSFKRKTKIRFLANSQKNHTAFELFTLDREGLLAQIGNIFNQHSLNLVNAKITTIGERVEDFFVVTNSQGKALDEMEKAQLKQQLLDELAG